jgi:hypothetical protein
MSILQNSYLSSGANIASSHSKYVPVDPEKYEGRWSGKYGNGTAFELAISSVQGFRAKVKYQSGSTVQYQQVLIRDNSFRIGDTKFMLSSNGTALVRTAVTDPATGSVSVNQAYAKQV